MNKTCILVTGAKGFVGGRLCSSLIKDYLVRGAVRRPNECSSIKGFHFVRGHLSADFDWSIALAGISVVVHCAGRVHVMNEECSHPLAEFRKVNVDGTLCLANQAAAAGVKRFVFLSSIKVNGEQTQAGHPFNADQEHNPKDPYGISKMEAEDGLRALARETGMEVVIIRPPLVYGPGVKANFLAMMHWLMRDVPLPFGGVSGNKRSLVALDNLVDLIATCVDHPAAANQTFLVSDGESLSTSELLQRMGRALGHPARLIPIPVSLLQLGATLFGKRDLAQRLFGSLEIDISKTKELLGWVPPISVEEGLRRTAAHWLASQQAASI